MHDAVITGIGTISPYGVGYPAFEEHLKNNNSAIKNICALDTPLSKYLSHAALLPNGLISSYLETLDKNNATELLAYNKCQRQAIHVQAAILCCLESWKDANLCTRNVNKKNIGLIVSGQNATQYLAEQQNEATDPSKINPRNAIVHSDFHQVAILSEIFDIQGTSICMGANSASSSQGIIHAIDLVQSGLLDQCIVVGALTILSPSQIKAYSNLGVLFNDPENPHYTPPLDKESSGFIYGQACASIIIENRKHVPYEVTIKGRLHRGSFLLDSNSNPNPNTKNQEYTMRQAIKNANINPEDIDYINLHATGTPLGDISELHAIENIFASHNVKLNSTKSLLGHCLWSAKIVELIATICQFQNNFIHDNYLLANPISMPNHLSTRYNLCLQGKYALCNAYGFGGINCSFIYERFS